MFYNSGDRLSEIYFASGKVVVTLNRVDSTLTAGKNGISSFPSDTMIRAGLNRLVRAGGVAGASDEVIAELLDHELFFSAYGPMSFNTGNINVEKISKVGVAYTLKFGYYLDGRDVSLPGSSVADMGAQSGRYINSVSTPVPRLISERIRLFGSSKPPTRSKAAAVIATGFGLILVDGAGDSEIKFFAEAISREDVTVGIHRFFQKGEAWVVDGKETFPDTGSSADLITADGQWALMRHGDDISTELNSLYLDSLGNYNGDADLKIFKDMFKEYKLLALPFSRLGDTLEQDWMSGSDMLTSDAILWLNHGELLEFDKKISFNPRSPYFKETFVRGIKLTFPLYQTIVNSQTHLVRLVSSYRRNQFGLGRDGSLDQRFTTAKKHYPNAQRPKAGSEFSVILDGRGYDVSGHMTNMLFCAVSGFVNISRYFDTVEGNILSSLMKRRMPRTLRNTTAIAESGSSNSTFLWHNYLEYRIAGLIVYDEIGEHPVLTMAFERLAALLKRYPKFGSTPSYKVRIDSLNNLV
jgi:hypothetical protein